MSHFYHSGSSNVWCLKNCTKHSSKTLLRLVQFLMHQTLRHILVQFILGQSKCQLNKLWLGHTLSQEPYLKRRGKWCRSLTTVVNTIMAVCEVGSSPRSWYIVYFVAFERRCSIVVRCKAGCNCIPHCGVLNQNQTTVEHQLFPINCNSSQKTGLMPVVKQFSNILFRIRI